MNVILLKEVKNLGKEGDKVKVSDGYARNFLIPRDLAAPHSESAMKIIEARKKKALQELEKEKEKSKEIAKKIASISLNIPMESGDNDMLFGSVTTEAIAKALAQEGIDTDRRNIIIKDPIKKLGIYNVEVKLHAEIKESLRIWVVKK